MIIANDRWATFASRPLGRYQGCWINLEMFVTIFRYIDCLLKTGDLPVLAK